MIDPVAGLEGHGELLDLGLGDAVGVVDHLVPHTGGEKDRYHAMVGRAALHVAAGRAVEAVVPRAAERGELEAQLTRQ